MGSQYRNWLFSEVNMVRGSQLRNIHDALAAFWPGLAVLAGDLRPAILTHELLAFVVRKFQFLPEVTIRCLSLWMPFITYLVALVFTQFEIML